MGYKALLKDIRLINFFVDEEELLQEMPALPLFKINDKPVISLLDVKLFQLQPTFLFKGFQFSYRHIAFRVLIKDDRLHTDGVNRGIYYLHSFTNNPFIACCGMIFTNFNFRPARIDEDENSFSLHHKRKWLNYKLDFDNDSTKSKGLMQKLMQIDRAYSLNGKGFKFTQVRRNDLPLHPVCCSHFATNFFETSRFIDAYCVSQPLNYEWLPARQCTLGN